MNKKNDRNNLSKKHKKKGGKQGKRLETEKLADQKRPLDDLNVDFQTTCTYIWITILTDDNINQKCYSQRKPRLCWVES